MTPKVVIARVDQGHGHYGQRAIGYWNDSETRFTPYAHFEMDCPDDVAFAMAEAYNEHLEKSNEEST